MDIGGKLLRRLCADQDVYAFIMAKLGERYFFTDDEKKLFGFVQQHCENYSVLPQEKTLLEAFPGLPDAVEPVGYYLDKLETRFAHKLMNKELGEASMMLEGQNIQGAVDLIQKMLGTLYESGMRHQMAEFSQDAYDIITQEYLKAQKGEEGVLFGWPYLDNMTGGVYPGDTVGYVGRPAVGKTYKLLYSAHHAWWRQQVDTLFVSMEMVITPLVQRLAAMHTHVNISELKKGELPKSHLTGDVFQKKVQAKLLETKNHKAKLWVLDGNLTSTPQEIFTIAQQFKPKIVFIDGAYLLRHENPRLDRHTKVAENVEAIKKLTTRAGIGTVCSFQFNRDAAKKKDIEDVGLEDIGMSDAIGQTCSIVLGLFQAENVETMQKRTINVLKGREGAVGKFDVRWDFKKMDFSEIDKNEDVSTLKFV